MPSPPNSHSDDSPGLPEYEICVRGRLDQSWSFWFGGLQLRVTPSSDTIISGAIPDQAALHGLLERIRDMNIELLSVQRLDQPEV